MLLSTASWSINGVRELNVGDNSVRVPTVFGWNWEKFDPMGTYMNPRRRTGFAGVAAIAVNDGTMASSKGSAKVTPTPRRNCLRGSAFFVTIIEISSFE